MTGCFIFWVVVVFLSYTDFWTPGGWFISNWNICFFSGAGCFCWSLRRCECVTWSSTASDGWPLPPALFPFLQRTLTPPRAATQCGSTTAETTLVGGNTLRWAALWLFRRLCLLYFTLCEHEARHIYFARTNQSSSCCDLIKLEILNHSWRLGMRNSSTLLRTEDLDPDILKKDCLL